MTKISIFNFQFSNPKKAYKGFTLIELVLYVAISSMFMIASVSFAWDIIYGRVKSYAQQEVNQNMRLASKRIVYEIRNASSITSVSGSTLTLAMADATRNPTIISLSGGRIRIGYGSSGSCPTATPCFLTDNSVNVSTLGFTDLSQNPNTSNIGFVLTIQTTGDREEFQEIQTYSGSAELRSK